MQEIKPISDEDSIRKEAIANAPPPRQISNTPPRGDLAQSTSSYQDQTIDNGLTADSPQSERLTHRLKNIRRLFFITLISCVSAVALVSVASILIGEFNDAFRNTIWVIVSMAIHSSIILSYTSTLFKQEERTGRSSFTITNVALFSLLILSFLISILSIWDIMSAEMSIRSYIAMLVILVASIHSDVLNNLRNLTTPLNITIAFNFAFIVTVALMLVVAIIGAGEQWPLLAKDSFFWRSLGAAGVVDASLTVISAILLKMWQQLHPDEAASSRGRQVSVGPFVVNLLVILIILIFCWPLILLLLGILWYLIGAIANPFLLLV